LYVSDTYVIGPLLILLTAAENAEPAIEKKKKHEKPRSEIVLDTDEDGLPTLQDIHVIKQIDAAAVIHQYITGYYRTYWSVEYMISDASQCC
jgi:hypothetical protein